MVGANCDFHDSAQTTSFVEPPSLHVPLDESTASIATLRQFSTDATALLTDLTEARPLSRTELNVKICDGGQLISIGRLCCDA
jgi:hypothetical protein